LLWGHAKLQYIKAKLLWGYAKLQYVKAKLWGTQEITVRKG